MTHTGKIFRRHDGNYCFSCNHCDEYFDIIHEIIAHMNKVLTNEADPKNQHKLDIESFTEFVDVSVPLDVKDDPIEDSVSDASSDDDNVVVTEEHSVSKTILDNKNSSVPAKRKRTIIINGERGTKKNPIREAKSSSYELESNLQSNSRTDLIKCCWCPETFNDFGLVQNHLTDEHNKKSSDAYSCDECQLFFKNLRHSSQHVLSHHGPEKHEIFRLAADYQENTKPIQCIVCELSINGTKAFDAHTKEAHKMYRILQCYVCGIFKKKPSGLLEHLKVHDRFRRYRCYECDSREPKITNPNDLRSHKCVLCSIWFPNHATIRNHLTDVHGQDQIYDCNICDDFTFKTEWELKMHGVNVHEIPSEYKSAHHLHVHQRSHSTSSNGNVCPICGSKFRRNDYLMRHIKSHSEADKAFKCYLCKKAFRSNGYLKNHIKRHTEKKMHQCDVCGNRFLLAGLLRKHMKEHEGEIWKCAQCPKEFSNKSKLTAHEKTHVTERNFRCDVSVL